MIGYLGEGRGYSVDLGFESLIFFLYSFGVGDFDLGRIFG